MLKSVGLSEESWDTPQLISVGLDRKGGSQILWVLLARKERIQSRAVPVMPASWSLAARVQCEMVLKAAERSIRMRTAVWSWLSSMRMSSVAARRAVLVLWNPD